MNELRGIWHGETVDTYKWITGCLSYAKDYWGNRVWFIDSKEEGAVRGVPRNPRRMYGFARQKRKSHFRGAYSEIFLAIQKVVDCGTVEARNPIDNFNRRADNG